MTVAPGTSLGPYQIASRFNRGVQVLASLNHPNIAAIYGLEDSRETRTRSSDSG